MLLTSSATATGASASIEEGVYFVRGQFVRVPSQRIVLDKYTNTLIDRDWETTLQN